MRKPRIPVPIPLRRAAPIEREVRRREQRDALQEAAGSWKDEDHRELAEGADKWVRDVRQESVKRFEKLQRHARPA